MAQFHAKDRAAWTAWLEAHHASATEIHLVFRRKGSGAPSITYDEAVEEALCFGWIDGVKHKLDDTRYTYRFTPRRKGSAWSDANKQRIARLDDAGVLRPAGQRAIDEARATGAWDKPAKAVMPEAMPPELVAGFARNKRARAAYDAQAPGMQKSWQRWIHQAKQAETRERRAKQAIACLANGDPHPWLLGRTAEKAKAAAQARARRR
ncbi:MAG: YdeI/OmpD-associated family protein [Kofleriaceae bacterium]